MRKIYIQLFPVLTISILGLILCLAQPVLASSNDPSSFQGRVGPEYEARDVEVAKSFLSGQVDSSGFIFGYYARECRSDLAFTVEIDWDSIEIEPATYDAHGHDHYKKGIGIQNGLLIAGLVRQIYFLRLAVEHVFFDYCFDNEEFRYRVPFKKVRIQADDIGTSKATLSSNISDRSEEPLLELTLAKHTSYAHYWERPGSLHASGYLPVATVLEPLLIASLIRSITPAPVRSEANLMTAIEALSYAGNDELLLERLADEGLGGTVPPPFFNLPQTPDVLSNAKTVRKSEKEDVIEFQRNVIDEALAELSDEERSVIDRIAPKGISVWVNYNIGRQGPEAASDFDPGPVIAFDPREEQFLVQISADFKRYKIPRVYYSFEPSFHTHVEKTGLEVMMVTKEAAHNYMRTFLDDLKEYVLIRNWPRT